MEPLERAARALCELAGNPPGAAMGGKPLWMDYLPEVRAVIKAIREPSDGVISSAAHLFEGAVRPTLEGDEAKKAWRLMIDAVLEVAS